MTRQIRKWLLLGGMLLVCLGTLIAVAIAVGG